MIFQRFEVLETLSRRNSVATYKCRDSELGLVVLKVFGSPSVDQKTAIRQLSASLLRLSHPGLQRHLECIEEGESLALVFAWVEGKTLAQEIESGTRYSDDDIFTFLATILEALQVAHSLNPAQIHRDIKPENVVRTSTGWVLIDFGASREAVLGDGEVSVIGTTGYAAPEQFFGHATSSSDQYGLGATALHLATHRHPTDFPLKRLKLDLASSSLSRPLLKVLERMLSPEPNERFVDVAAALEAVRSGSGMAEWELALEPLADVNSVLQTRVDGDGIQIQIEPRYKKLPLFMSVMVPFGYLIVELAIGKASPPNILLVFSIFVLSFFPLFHREWSSMKRWSLQLSPRGWQLMRNGKIVSEGAQPPEIVQFGGFLQGMDLSLEKRSPVRLKQVDGVSPVFGYSLTAKEAEVLSDIVASYYRPYRKEPNKSIDSESVHALTVRAPDYLQKSDKRPTPLRAISSLVQISRELPATPGREKHFGKVPTTSLELIQRFGFRKIGYLKESVLGLVGPAREVYLSEDGAIALHIAPGVFGNSSSDFTYYMASLMDNGSYRLTWSHTNPTTPTDGLVYSAGSVGGFAKDVEAHRDWVRKQFAEAGSRPVSMATMDDRVAVLTHYHRQCESISTSIILVTTAISVLTVTLLIIYVVILAFLA